MTHSAAPPSGSPGRDRIGASDVEPRSRRQRQLLRVDGKFWRSRCPTACGALLVMTLAAACTSAGGTQTTAPEPRSVLTAPSDTAAPTPSGPFHDPSIKVAELPDVGPPVKVSPEDRFEFIAACMADRGFQTTVVYQGILFDTVPEEQGPVLNAASEACMAKYPLPQGYGDPPTRGQLNLIYDYFRDRLRPCLQAEGLDVREAPSREVFVDAGSEYFRIYNPYDDAQAGDPTRYYDQCPPNPTWAEMLAAK